MTARGHQRPSADNTEPTRHPSAGVGLADELASVVRERIYSRQYPTAARLRWKTLARELGVSRTPLREALRVLEQEGLVRVDPGQVILLHLFGDGSVQPPNRVD
jgi:DNA-binding GntR family transcriptional regulator